MIKPKYQKTIAVTVLGLIFVINSTGQTFAQETAATNTNLVFSKHISTSEIKNKIEFNAFDNKILFSFKPNAFKSDTDFDVIKLNETIPEPWQLDRISAVYQIEIKNKAAFQKMPYEVKINYNENDNFKKLFFYDKNCSCWKQVDTKDNTWRNMASGNMAFDYVRLAVFSYPNVPMTGRASWYAHKNGMFTASPDFPAGTRLRVLNKSNNKFVDVTVNDYGPNRSIHPDRVVDLDKAAFKKIAATSAGSVPVIIEVLALPKNTSSLFGVANSGAKTVVAIDSGSAAIYNEAGAGIIWSKNATTSRPLASLTKIMAASVFMATKPTLTDVVPYKTQDEKYNYEWCKPWESAKLKITEGETLTIADLLYTSLVGSANNTIESLVRVSGLSRADFIAKMNEKALEWGASSTRFYEPTGLSPQNVSSAADYVIIAREALSDPIIQKASVMSEYKFSTVNTKKEHRIKNTNKLTIGNGYQLTGSKTGYLDEAGYCLMTRIKKGAESLILVVMGAPDKNKSYQDTLNLINYGFRIN